MGAPPTIQVASIGMADSLILMIMALVVFGPRRLPQIGRQIGKLMYEFRKASNDFKFQMEEELRAAEEADRRKREEEERQRRLALNPPTDGAAGEPSADAADTSTEYDPYGASETPYGESGSDSYASSEAEVAAPHEIPAPEDDSAPRIQPPSTGETVSSAAPGSRGSSAVNEAVSAEHEPVSAEKEPAVHDTGAVTEQTAHNG